MEPNEIQFLATLRAVVGYLGERDQAGWWASSFLAPDSTAFLAPVFPRTQTLAQCTAVTRAAALVHDERIGVGERVYHLFRLPEDEEHRLHDMLHEPQLIGTIVDVVTATERAVQFLRDQAGEGAAPSSVGPTKVGDLHDLRLSERWRDVAAQYLRGVEASVEIYPYFADRA